MTASAIQGDREKCLESGMNNYLAKPVRAQTLKALLESYLNKEGEGKDIPNIQDEAKKLVKRALSDSPGSTQVTNGAKSPQEKLVEEEKEAKIRSRPPSVRSSTTKWLGPNGKDENSTAS